MEKAAPDIAVIQYLRGIAATMVVVAHAADQIGPSASVASKIGMSGVDIFFVISGFIMTYTTATRSYSRAGFMWKRLLRIVPIYWAATCVAALIASLAPALFKRTVFTWPEFFTSLFFIPFPNPANGEASPLLKLGWTLNYEMLFYILFCVLLPWRIWARIVTLAAIFGITFVANRLAPSHYAALEFYGGPIMFEFVIGCIVGYLFVRGLRLPATMTALLMIGSAVLFLRGASTSPQTLIFCGLPAAGIVTCLLLLQSAATWRSRALHALGDASYSMYCTHLFFVIGTAVVWHRLFGDFSTPIKAIGYVLACVGVSVLVGITAYFRIEAPLLTWCRSWRTPRPVEVPAE